MDGVIPIVAHAERTALPYAPSSWTELLNWVACCRSMRLDTVMAEPVTRVEGWFKRGLVACVASDAHGVQRRPPMLTVSTVDMLPVARRPKGIGTTAVLQQDSA